jgi:hypothetical protein
MIRIVSSLLLVSGSGHRDDGRLLRTVRGPDATGMLAAARPG